MNRFGTIRACILFYTFFARLDCSGCVAAGHTATLHLQHNCHCAMVTKALLFRRSVEPVHSLCERHWTRSMTLIMIIQFQSLHMITPAK
ncbi:hypothetical protein BDR07DRAFT_1395801 [Suillus spraguei]|nr:hypothetical protein BDR07DRAFT_1395801 [Suillus spraguei]